MVRGGEGAATRAERIPRTGERTREALSRDRASEPAHASFPHPSGLVRLLNPVVTPLCGAYLTTYAAFGS